MKRTKMRRMKGGGRVEGERPSPEGGAPTPVIDAARNAHEYQRISRFYDLLAAPRFTNGVRREAVARLRLRPGDSAMDLGCGTGLNIPMLVRAVGSSGRVVAVDLSPDQLKQTRERAGRLGLRNVSLVQANAEELPLDEKFDGILSSYTHDIMTSPLAVERAAVHLKPGGRFVALGFCRPTGWRAPLNLLFMAFYRLFNIPINWDAETSDRPWSYLEAAVGRVKVERRFLGIWYRAVATKQTA